MRKVLILVLLVMAFFVRSAAYEKKHVSHIPDNWFGKTMSVTGIVTDDPDRGLDATKITLGDVGILVTLPSGVSVSYGDKVEVYGKVERPDAFMTDTGREFDYPAYLAVHDIYATMKGSDIRILGHHYRSRLVEYLFSVKKYFVGTIKNLFPESEAGLFAGIVIGEKSLLPKETLSDFQIAGLTHMIVLSGYNITIVAVSMIAILSWCGLGYQGRRVGAILAIPVFLVITGMGASSVRAGIMSTIVFFLQITTRPAHPLRVILYTLVVMVFSNPRLLLHDPSFHMSFLAFVGLIYVTPITEKIFGRFGEWFGLKSLIVETLSVQVFVMPYILWMSGRFSLLLLLSNILTVPLVPFIMGSGFIAVVTGMLWYSLGALVAIPVRSGLAYIIMIAHSVANVSPLIVTVPPFGPWLMLAAYAIMVALVIAYNKPS